MCTEYCITQEVVTTQTQRKALNFEKKENCDMSRSNSTFTMFGCPYNYTHKETYICVYTVPILCVHLYKRTLHFKWLTVLSNCILYIAVRENQKSYTVQRFTKTVVYLSHACISAFLPFCLPFYYTQLYSHSHDINLYCKRLQSGYICSFTTSIHTCTCTM